MRGLNVKPTGPSPVRSPGFEAEAMTSVSAGFDATADCRKLHGQRDVLPDPRAGCVELGAAPNLKGP